MKYTLVKLLVVLFFTLSSFANDEINATLKIENNTALPKQKSIFLSYEDVPHSAYVGEVFTIKLKAIIANSSDFEDITTTFQDYDQNSTTILNPESKWQWFSDNIFYNTYYIKIQNEGTKLPKIVFNLLGNEVIVDSESIQSAKTNIIKLNGDKYFSSVIASSLKVNKYKTTQFNDKNHIIVIEMEAKDSNLGDFKLNWVQKDGIDSFQDNLPFFKIFYYAIIPNYQKNFVFSYFNSEKNDFEKISLPIVVDADEVSTQIGLNPKESSLQAYKNGFYAFIILSFVVLFIRRRKFIYILLIVALLLLIFYDKTPINDIKIEPNTKVKILPTENSTIFHTIDRPMYAERLAVKKEYIKILLPNGKIGWIKEKSVIKD